MYTYAIKWDKKVLVTPENDLSGYTYIQQDTLDPIDEAYRKFNEALAPITSSYSENEQKTFSKKLIEAERVKEGKNSKFINELLKEGETADELADKIIANNNAYETIYATAEKQLAIDLANII